MLRFGIISEVDVAKGYARVKFLDDDIVSAPLQFIVRSALQDKDNFTFDINEQVACLMDENSEQGVILGAMFNDKTPPSEGGGPGIYKVKFSDDSFLEYNRNTHECNINVQGKVNIIATEEIDITAPEVKITGAVTVEGNLTVSGEVSGATVKAGSINLGTHKHGGVSTGGGQTGTPV